ncbi:MAG: BolA family transcriptional regulator [Myxococcales bacterium]|nr:MAG: BolA family transcriptional regulator [Myxococcales bacterium]
MHSLTKDAIEKILQEQFKPLSLEVIDDSHAHRGHAAALEQPQAGHFSVMMVSEAFNGLNQVKRHRLVYQALGELMHAKIHALSLNLRAIDE